MKRKFNLLKNNLQCRIVPITFLKNVCFNKIDEQIIITIEVIHARCDSIYLKMMKIRKSLYIIIQI